MKLWWRICLVLMLLLLMPARALAQTSNFDTNIGASNPFAISGFQNGDIVYFDNGVFNRLPIGTNGYVLTAVMGLPAWAPGGGGGGSPGGSNFSTQYNNGGVFGGTGPGTTGQVLTSNGASAAPTFQAVAGTGTVTSVSNSDGTLTLSPNPITSSGTVSLALGHANTWTGAPTFNAFTTLGNGLKLSTFTFTAAGNLTIPSLSNNCVYAIAQASAAPMAVNLPPLGNTGQTFMIVDKGGTASGTNVQTITPAGSDTIDGAPNLPMSVANYCITLEDQGTQWTVLTAFNLPPQLQPQFQTFITQANETSSLPNSFQLLAGTGITLTPSSNTLTIAAPGASLNQSFFTQNNESSTLPNSVQLVAGSGIQLVNVSSSPNITSVNASGGILGFQVLNLTMPINLNTTSPSVNFVTSNTPSQSITLPAANLCANKVFWFIFDETGLPNGASVFTDIADTYYGTGTRLVGGNGVIPMTGTIFNAPVIGIISDGISKWYPLAPPILPLTMGGTGLNFTSIGSSLQFGTCFFDPTQNSGAGSLNFTLPGTSGQALISAGTSAGPAYGTLGVVGGGTGLTSCSAGDLLIGNGANSLTNLPIGTPGQILTTVSGAPSWQDPNLPSQAVIAWWSTDATVPTGYALCNGQTVTLLTGPHAGSMIATPNLIGMFIQGSDLTGGSSTANPNGFGSQANQSQVGAATHTHTYSGTTTGPSAFIGDFLGVGAAQTYPNDVHTHDFSGTTSATNTQPPSYAMVYLMKLCPLMFPAYRRRRKRAA